MTLKIIERYLRLLTTHEIRSALAKVFYDGSDEQAIISPELQQVRGEILRMDPILNLERTCSYVHRDTNRKTDSSN